jgi:pyruvate dehydrogenase E1 component
MHRVREASGGEPGVRLLGSGSILREVLAAAEILEEEHDVSAEVHSVTSFTELRREGMEAERWSRLNPTEPRRVPWVEEQLPGDVPIVASTDYMRAVPDQIRPYVPGAMHVLGTDGFGRSDSREALRRFFEIDRHHVVATVLWALAGRGEVAPEDVEAALDRYDIEREDLPPWRR